MGQIKHFNNGKWTVYTSGEDLTQYTGGTPDTIYVGNDEGTGGIYTKVKSDGTRVDLESSGINTDNYVTGGTYSNGTLTLDRQDGSIIVNGFYTGGTNNDYYVTGGTYSNGTLTLDRQDGSVSITGFFTGITVDVTYVELVNMVGTNSLKVGVFYNITDFATSHIIPNSGGVINTGTVEPLLVKAIAVNRLDVLVTSKDYPQDIIHYELVDTSTAGGDKGRIFYREDTKQNISTGYDWRNVKFRRFRNAQTLNLVVGGGSLNNLGSKITGGTSGAVGYVIGGIGANILRVVNVSGVFINGEIITQDSGATRTINTVADYSVDADTHVSNGRSSSDVYTFVDAAATGIYNIKIPVLSSAGPTDKLNNITFLAGSHDVYFAGDAYNCSMSTCYNFKANGSFYDNYFRGTVSDFFFSTDAYTNRFYNNSFRNTITANFLSNTIAGGFDNNTIAGYYFGLNTVAYGFRYNNSNVRVASSVINTPNMAYNIIDGDVQGQTFLYTATEITQLWTKHLLKASNGTYYLEYYNGGAVV